MARVSITVGRSRVGRATSPRQAGYITDIRAQLKLIHDNLHKIVNGIKNATPDAMLFAMKPIAEEADRLVPRDTGRLAHSQFLVARKTASGASLAFGYARNNSPAYAQLVHEDLEMRHAAPTQAKFAEQAVKNFLHLVPRRIRDFMKKDVLGLN